jgi:uncharacterized protein YlzI (FlbEa/FlbD family)
VSYLTTSVVFIITAHLLTCGKEYLLKEQNEAVFNVVLEFTRGSESFSLLE